MLTYLSSCYIDGSNNVGCVGVKPANRSRHGRANQILASINFQQCLYTRFQNLKQKLKAFSDHTCTASHLLHYLCRYDCITHHILATPLYPVHGRGFLVHTKVPTDADYIDIRKYHSEMSQTLFNTLQE